VSCLSTGKFWSSAIPSSIKEDLKWSGRERAYHTI
jgi:hypothetical protein